VLYMSLRAGFLHLLTQRFSAFTCFLKAFSFGDHHGTYFAFGRKGAKHVLHISPSSSQIVVIAVSSCFFVAALFIWSPH